MDSVIYKEQRLSEGHSEVEDEPRKGAEERDPPRGRNPRLAGATASGVPVTQHEEWLRMEPPHGARPKWNRLGRPTSVIEEPRGLGAEVTGV